MYNVLVDCETGENMTDSGVDSELSPSSPDSITETSSINLTSLTSLTSITSLPSTPSMVIQTPANNSQTVARSAEELVAKMEEEDEEEECEDKIADKMETVEALLSLSDASRSPVGSPEKPLITILPAHNPDKGESNILLNILWSV